MDIIERIKKDKPHHVTIDVENREDPEIIRIKRGKGQKSSWLQLQRTLEALDWIGLQTRNSDDELISAYGEQDSDNPEQSEIPYDPRAQLPPDDPEVAKYKVLTSAQLTVLEPFNRFAEIIMGKQDALFELVLNQMRELQQENIEARKQIAELTTKQDASDQKMNIAMTGLSGILQKIAPQLAEGAMNSIVPMFLGSARGPDGGNGVQTGIPGPGIDVSGGSSGNEE